MAETAVRNLDIVTRLKGGEQVKAGFDAEKVSAKDLQDRIKDLDTRMKELTASYGKQAYESKAGLIVQRERKLAMEQLIAMEEKAAVATGKSVRGLGSLASATMAASGSISGLGTGVSVLSNALMSGVGLTGALAAAVIGFSLMMEAIRGAREEQEKLNEEIAGFITITTSEGTFNITGSQIEGTLQQLRNQRIMLKEYGGNLSAGRVGFMPFGTKEFSKEEKERLSILDASIDVLEEANEKYKRQSLIMQTLSEAGMNYTETNKKINKGLKETKENLDRLNDPLKMLRDLYQQQQKRELPPGMGGLPSKFNMSMVAVPELPPITFTKKEFEEQYGMYADMIRDTANIFRSEFGSAWEDVFGEANSLFEKLIASWAQTMADKLIKKGLGGLLDFIPGGEFVSELLEL